NLGRAIRGLIVAQTFARGELRTCRLRYRRGFAIGAPIFGSSREHKSGGGAQEPGNAGIDTILTDPTAIDLRFNRTSHPLLYASPQLRRLSGREVRLVCIHSSQL